MTPETMHNKLLKLFKKVQEKGTHPPYRPPEIKNYLELKKDTCTLTIRQDGSCDTPYGMNYVAIQIGEVMDILYIREDMSYYDRKIKNDQFLKNNYKRVGLINQAYKIFI